jgi:hypothetical protein
MLKRVERMLHELHGLALHGEGLFCTAQTSVLGKVPGVLASKYGAGAATSP